MMYRVVGALVASLSVAAVALPPNAAYAGAGTPHGTVSASPHVASHAPAIRSFRHHRRGGAIFFPGIDAFDYGTPSGEPLVDATQPPSGDVNYTYKYDVPWDWAHRYPPAVAPSDRPYVSSCPEETTKFPGRDGKDQTVNVMRCY